MTDAYQTFASKNAELDFNEQRLRRLLAQRLMLSKEERQESLNTSRENNSARGLLQSGIALNDQQKRNTAYDRQDADTQQTADDTLAGIGRDRAQISADYLASKAEEERQAALLTPLMDTTDPLGWKKIAADMAAAGDPRFTGNSDPNNWAGIAAEQASLGNPNYTGMARAALTPTRSARPSPAKTPTRSVNPVRRPITTAIFS